MSRRSIISAALVLFASVPCLACQPEAQIIAKVERAEMASTDCFVKLDPFSVRFFAPNQLCPLVLEDVIYEGVHVALNAEQKCSLKSGDTLTGVVYRNAQAVLVLE